MSRALGSKMHYVEEGEGEVFLLLHGNPTSSYPMAKHHPHAIGEGIANWYQGLGG